MYLTRIIKALVSKLFLNRMLVLIALLTNFSLSYAQSPSPKQSMMVLSGLVTQTFINSLLYFDGDHRSKEAMQKSMSDIDTALSLFVREDFKDAGSLNEIKSQWLLVNKHIKEIPEEAGYSYFYLERLSKSIEEMNALIDQSIVKHRSGIHPKNYEIFLANSDMLKVVSMHLSSAVMDVGNDDASKTLLKKHCLGTDEKMNAVVANNPKVKSYVLRSWKYIQAPICVTGKSGGNYTIAHFSKQIFTKLNGLYVEEDRLSGTSM